MSRTNGGIMAETKTFFLIFILIMVASRGIFGFIAHPVPHHKRHTQNLDLWSFAGVVGLLWAGIISVLSYFIQYI